MTLQRPKGTKDHLPDGSPQLKLDVSARAFKHVIDTAARVLERGGATFMATPLFEEADLVKRGVGGSTDIVRKEMYTVSYQTDAFDQVKRLKNRNFEGKNGEKHNLKSILPYINKYIIDRKRETRRDLPVLDTDRLDINFLDGFIGLIEIENEDFILEFLKDAANSLDKTSDTNTFVLRPEGTAGLVRAYLENGLKQLPSPLKLWTHGPMFRAENVQKGRLRQFHQVDYEVLGSADPLIDAEAIWLMVQVVQALGLTGVQVKLGSIGDPEDRDTYNAYLRELFTPHLERLSDDSKDRLERNPMRILDSKSAGDQALILELSVKPMLDFLGTEARMHFGAVRGHLDSWKVAYVVDPSIVRGLDYYRRTAWELHHAHIGAKSALGGGGRYDGLAKELGGPETPGIGWAFGIERILGAMEQEGLGLPAASGPLVYIAALDAEHVPLAARVALDLRSDMRADFGYKPQKPGNAFREGERRGAVFTALIGSNEAAAGTVALRHMASGEQRNVPMEELSALLLARPS